MAKIIKALVAAGLAFLAGVAHGQFTQSTGYFSSSGSSGSGDGSITIGSAISGSCTSGYLLYNNAGVIGCLQAVSTVATPAPGDLPYYDSASSQALLTAASCTATNPILSGGTGAAPTCGSVTTPSAAGTGRLMQVVFESSASRDFANVANGSCDTITVAATGVLTTDNVDITFSDNLETKTGWNGAGTMVTFTKQPTADNVVLKACNYTGGADINPDAVVINIKAFR